MACPFFAPMIQAAENPGFRLPLGAFWRGECRAGVSCTVDSDTQLNSCNFGYAVGCANLPPAREADAVRFTRFGTQTLFVLERNHLPVRFGQVADIPPGTLLRLQADAWKQSL